MKLCLSSIVLVAGVVAAGPVAAQNPGQHQSVTLSRKIKIPGATLKAGNYNFSIEDRLQDRAIVRITSQDQSKHFLVLTLPDAKLTQVGTDGLVRFTTAKGKDEALRAWACPGCDASLEFVYPKAEAAKLIEETADPVSAVDPSYDKLPATLTPDDMKVVTLWLLSPETITASNKGKGVKAVKWASTVQPAATTQVATAAKTEASPMAPADQSPMDVAVKPASPAELAQTPIPGPQAATPASQAVPAPSVEMAAVSTPQTTAAASPLVAAHRGERLPKTASSTFTYLFSGMVLLLAALTLRLAHFIKPANER